MYINKIGKHILILTSIIILSLLNTHNSIYATANDETSSINELDHQIILLFQDTINPSRQIHIVKQVCNLANVLSQEDNYMLIELPKYSNTEDIMKQLSQYSEISTIERNSYIYPMELTKDTYSSSQWSLLNEGSYRSYSSSSSKKISSAKGVDLNVSLAWQLYNRNDAKSEVTVAVIDTGIDTNHEDLSDCIWINPGEVAGDGIDNDNNGYIDDIYGWDFYNNDATVCHYSYDKANEVYEANPNDDDDHGTHCAGIIGATANNNLGIAGVASNINVKLMSLKIEGGSKGNGTIANAIEAIKYAEKMGAKICNISWGSNTFNAPLEKIMKESSMLFIAAAGNRGTDNNKTPVYPASFDLDNIISVTFINASGKLGSLSNYGNESVDLAAPGYDILSTTVGDTYTVMSGSSMAVPHITGVAAIIYSYAPGLYASDVKKLLVKNTSHDKYLEGKLINPGIPSVLSIVNDLNNLKIDIKKPTLSISTSFDEDEILITVKPKDTGGSGVRVIKYLYGKHSLADFESGTVGTSIHNNKTTLKKAGNYTFYISDYAGNEKKYIKNIKDDKTPPTIETSYHSTSKKGSYIITATIDDIESGIRLVKYISGKKTINDLNKSDVGEEITSSNSEYTIPVNSKGSYTIYAVDHRGNKSISVIKIK